MGVPSFRKRAEFCLPLQNLIKLISATQFSAYIGNSSLPISLAQMQLLPACLPLIKGPKGWVPAQRKSPIHSVP